MSESRLTHNQLLKQIILLVAHRGTCLRKKVGCVITIDSRIISTGYVGAARGQPHCTPETCGPDKPCERTIHAEANAIAFAAKAGTPLMGAQLWTTLSPCMNCAKLIVSSGVTQVVFLEKYRDPEPLYYLHECGIIVRRCDEHGSLLPFNL